MTAKEKLLDRAPHWTEEQAGRALRAAEGDGLVDDWGDLDQFTRRLPQQRCRLLPTRSTLRVRAPGETGRGLTVEHSPDIVR